MKLAYWMIGLFIVLLAIAFKSENPPTNSIKEAPIKTEQPKNLINKSGTTIRTRFNLPEGFQRITTAQNSFAEYLQNLPLKPDGSKVQYYNGATKHATNVYAGVVDIDVGKRDLQQCADAIMRLRGEYLWQQKDYDNIHFDFTNGFQVDYTQWMKGNRMRIKGNKTTWYPSKAPSNTYKNFRAYMNLIFAYAGTLSLSKELPSVAFENMQIGDIFIQGGSPGHAIIVVDMAKHLETGKQLFLLAQSYMPAQDIQILQNPMNGTISPWYDKQFTGNLVTPEWRFRKGDLKRFE